MIAISKTQKQLLLVTAQLIETFQSIGSVATVERVIHKRCSQIRICNSVGKQTGTVYVLIKQNGTIRIFSVAIS